MLTERCPDLEALFPVETRCVVQRHPEGWADLHPEEAALVTGAVPRRLAQFAAGRRCARLAVELLGGPGRAIGHGAHREPLFPTGFLGSISHTEGMVVAAAARTGEPVRSLAVDVEPNLPLPREVLGEILFDEETTLADDPAGLAPGIALDRLVFCAKEVTYKAWNPLVGRWLGFEQAKVHLDPAARRFVSHVAPSARHDPTDPQQVMGGWTLLEGHLVAAGLVPA